MNKSSSSVAGTASPLRTSELAKKRSASKDIIEDSLHSNALLPSELRESCRQYRSQTSAGPEGKVHPVSRLIEVFIDVMDSTYTDRLRILGLGVGELEPLAQSAEFSDNVLSMQHIGMCFLEDIQEFLVTARMITNFFYRQCISLENQVFQEAIVEALTNILFTRRGGIVFQIVKTLFKAQHQDTFTELQTQMADCSDIKLSDMKVTFLGLETINWAEVEQAEEQKVKTEDGWQEASDAHNNFFDKQMAALQANSLRRKQSANNAKGKVQLADDEKAPSFGGAGAKKHRTFKKERGPSKVIASKPSSDADAGTSTGRNITCLLFKPQIEKMRSLGPKVKDPREMMEALKEIQAEISQ